MKKAVLCFVVKNGKMLLIRKKRGFGKGKIIAPGGKLELNETAEAAAKRETLEETKIKIIKPEKIGEIEFYFGDNREWIVHIVRANDFSGIAKETVEAIPKWYHIKDIPYDKMWPDDEYWVPLLLEKKKFNAKFFYDKEAKKILKHEITFSGSVV